MAETVLDVDMLAFENGSKSDRQAVVDGVMQSLKTGFVYTSHDMSQDFLDQVYGMLGIFFDLSSDEKQTVTAKKTFLLQFAF